MQRFLIRKDEALEPRARVDAECVQRVCDRRRAEERVERTEERDELGGRERVGHGDGGPGLFAG